MSLTRAQLDAAALAAVQALTLTGTPTVEAWDGDDRVFNDAAAFPHVAVGPPPTNLPRLFRSDLLEVGSATHERDQRFAVYVSSTSQSEADAILGEVEAGLLGVTLSGTKWPVEPVPGPAGAEFLRAVHLNRRLYVQTYRVRQVIA